MQHNKQEVFKINIKGKDINLIFAAYAISQFSAKVIENSLFNKCFHIEWCAFLLYAGYSNYCLLRSLKPSLTLEDFFDHVEYLSINKIKDEDIEKAIESLDRNDYASRVIGKGGVSKAVYHQC